MSRLLQIGFIWFGCAIAWVILGSTLIERSGESSMALQEEVQALWGPALELRPLTGQFTVMTSDVHKTTIRDSTGRDVETTVSKDIPVVHDIRLEGSELHAKLHLQHRQKGLLWFPTYDVEVDGRYRLRNDSDARRAIEFSFPLPGEHAIYDGFSVLDEQGKVVDVVVQKGNASWTMTLQPDEVRSFTVGLRSRGTSSFGYALTGGTGEVRDFSMQIETDFPEVDFPAGSISPTEHHRAGAGWSGEWKFSRLIAGMNIALVLPQRINPGPLASRITFFAPVGLLFFFFVVAVRAAAKGRDMHPLNYFFFGCAFFAFHLLFAYLVDHLAIAPALAIASVVSIGLVVSYARLFVGWRYALVEMGIAQLLYLVLFSTTFLWKGYTGLSITVGAVVTLFVMMQFTGRRRLVSTVPDHP